MRILFFIILLLTTLITKLVAPDTFDFKTDPIQSAESLYNIPIVEPVAVIHAEPTAVEIPDIVVPTQAPDPSAGPEALFGTPKITETFNRGSSGFGLNAGLNEDDGIRIIAIDNKLSLEPKKSNGWLSWRLRPPSLKDGAAEMEFSLITCARGDRTGIMLHAPDYTSGKAYYVSLACEGVLSILKESTILGSAQVQSIFKNNSGDINVLTAVISGDTITAFLNGQQALTVHDDSIPEGFSGFFTAAQGENTLKLEISSFKEYYPGE